MHDIDRALFEYQQEHAGPGAGELQETQEVQLAGELLELRDERELDRFLGDLIKGAVSAGKDFLASDAGRALGGVLKSAARQALPQLGRALGDVVAPGRGGQLGSRLGSAVAGRLGLETEGLSAEDRQFEVARAFVRFADTAARTAAEAPQGVPPTAVASRAATVAAAQHLPGLVPVLRQLRPPGPGHPGHRPPSGRWVRRGSTVVLFNV
jgi:hypothetical protein